MDGLLKNISFWMLIVLTVLFLYKFRQQPSAAPDLMDSARFTEALLAGRIARISLPPDATIRGELTETGPDGKPAPFLAAAPAYRELVDELLRRNVTVAFQPARETTLLTTILSWLPMLLVIGIWLYMMRSMRAAKRREEARPGSPIAP